MTGPPWPTLCGYPTHHDTPDGTVTTCPCGWWQRVPSKARGKRLWQQHRWHARYGQTAPWRRAPNPPATP